MVVVAVVAGAAVVFARSRGCAWGTISYSVGAEGAEGQTDLAVLREGEEVVVTNDGLAGHSSLSPDGARVAFESARPGSYDDSVGYTETAIHVADADGSNREPLTPGPDDANPSWAPDGSAILFLRNDEIRTVDVGSKKERLVYRLPRADRSDPSLLVDAEWSGDSRRIAFVVRRGGAEQSAELWAVGAGGSEPRRLASLLDGGVDEIAWSPDGETFAWTGYNAGVRSLFLMPAPSGRPRAVEPNAETPVWSSDGEQLAYVIGHEGHYGFRVVVGDADGSDPEQLPDSPEHMHDWASC